MSIVLPAVSVAFAGLCVWLGVRVYNRRERWAKRTLAAVVALPVLYFLSFGPVCWWLLSPHEKMGEVKGMIIYKAALVYWPIGWLYFHSPTTLKRPVFRYAFLAGTAEAICLPMDMEETKTYTIFRRRRVILLR